MHPGSALPPTQDPMAASDDSDYEYEYDDDAAETFYLNLDLTSCNGLIRAPRKRTASSHAPSTPDPPQPSTPLDSPQSSTLNAGDDQQATTTTSGADIDPDLENQPEDQVQIMDLHSENPILSYRNQIFTCSWVDLVGTEMTFSMPEERSTLPRLRQHKAYDLISANRVKILGQKANLIPGTINNNNNPSTTSTSIPAGNNDTSTYPPTSTLAPASVPVPTTNQGRFLERLMAAKRAKGESDVVRTTFAQKRNQSFEARLKGWARTGEQLAEVEQLNRRVAQGDMEALAALEELYARAEGPARERIGRGLAGMKEGEGGSGSASGMEVDTPQQESSKADGQGEGVS
ncbi:hypothetical protein AJ79_00085 [Helicocarpus griseus UAMH5409]|uniref:Transcription factor TFIIIC triple barrel domain-containing protein n=1 Tax=Helicocarpus griseus UAMH5409 TaxID=1447875 RepID=A0A2B7YDB5_9EURO|nr:hypothetical protein AJ79_00085 [Helicocarpus griseus UAMH5409]